MLSGHFRLLGGDHDRQPTKDRDSLVQNWASPARHIIVGL